MSPDRPDLTVVVVTPARFDQLRRTVRHVREQSVAHRVELLIVAPTEDAVADHRDGELSGFWGVEIVPVGPIPNVDKASAHGVRAARAPVVALVEDHAFTQPGWADAIGAALTSKEAMIGALRKLDAMPAPSGTAKAHLRFLFHSPFATHPSTYARIKALEDETYMRRLPVHRD